TTTLAVLFMVTSLLLQVVAAHKNKSGSVLDKENPAAKTQTSQPLKPGANPAPELPKESPEK
ncbi:MAG TPA: hypothetical protein VLQ89_05945, partial [Candidatus Binatia bacterium]|nr:hypothetical protein [Candidatus Binatia bacterium]